MGYYTRYDLTVESLDYPEIIEDLRNKNASARYALDENGDSEEGCKWYDRREDMVAFSKLYPDAFFILHGEGEEGGDLWRMYVKNGKVQEVKAEIVYAPFDESAME